MSVSYPILLFGKLLYGIYLNLSIWFKITDKTIYGTYFSLIGLVITIIGNLILIPLMGMVGAALTMVFCYLIMSFLCYYFGQKNYPVPYNFFKIIPYCLISLVLVYLAFYFAHPSPIINTLLRIILSIILVIILWAYEKRNLKAIKG